jgi:protein phosphatase
MSYRWWSSCASDRGQRRKINEDAFLALPERGLWVVADGMGGHARGDRASQMVVDAFQNFPSCANLNLMVEQAHRCLQNANDQVYAESQGLPDKQIMGSTVVVFLAFKHQYACLWAGDSRIYLLRDNLLQPLTKDHSVVQQMLDNEQITAEQARVHPASNRITRAVGAKPRIVFDEVRGNIQDGDHVLLCSDGLTVEVDESEIATVIGELDCDTAIQELIDLSLERGARDNVTVGIVQFEETTGFNVDHTEDATETTAVNYALRKQSLERNPSYVNSQLGSARRRARLG